MKPLLRALVWVGLGGGIGFFAGWQFGEKRKEKEMAEAFTVSLAEAKQHYLECAQINDEVNKEKMKKLRSQYEDALNAIREYKGLDVEVGIPNVETVARTVDTDDVSSVIVEEEADEMPMDEPEMPEDPLGDEEEIPQLHPQDLLPFSITKAEYTANENGYDLVDLDYYTEDCVIFDPREEEKWTHPEQLLGLGWKALFIGTVDGPVIREAYIQNDTMGTLYRITRIDDSFERLYEEE